jgi:hypothetical protein
MNCSTSLRRRIAIPRFSIMIWKQAAVFALTRGDLLCMLQYWRSALITLVSEHYRVISCRARSASSARNTLVSTHFFIIAGMIVKISLSTYLDRPELISVIRIKEFLARDERRLSTNFSTSMIMLWKVTGLMKTCGWNLLRLRKALRASNYWRHSCDLNALKILTTS